MLRYRLFADGGKWLSCRSVAYLISICSLLLIMVIQLSYYCLNSAKLLSSSLGFCSKIVVILQRIDKICYSLYHHRTIITIVEITLIETSGHFCLCNLHLIGNVSVMRELVISTLRYLLWCVWEAVIAIIRAEFGVVAVRVDLAM